MQSPFPVEPPRSLREDRHPQDADIPAHRSGSAGLSVRRAQVPRVGWALFNVCRLDLQGVTVRGSATTDREHRLSARAVIPAGARTRVEPGPRGQNGLAWVPDISLREIPG